MAITTPCVWDTDTTQNATQLALLTGLEGAVEKILVRVSSATTDVITGARTGSQWLALPFLSTWLNPTLLLITAVGAVWVPITAPGEGHTVATGNALEAVCRARVSAGARDTDLGRGRGPGRGGL